MSTTLERLIISTPGVDERGMFGIEELRLTNSYGADGVLTAIGDVLQNTAPPIGVTVLDDLGAAVAGIAAGDVRMNDAAVTIGGTVYEIGQAVLFTLTAQAGITPQWAWVFCDWTSVAGTSLAGKKRLQIVDALEMR